jgi:hypothetical protein
MTNLTWYYGYYWGLPVWIAEQDESSISIEGRYWIVNKLIDPLLMIDAYFFGYFPAVISNREAPEHIQEKLNKEYA